MNKKLRFSAVGLLMVLAAGLVHAQDETASTDVEITVRSEKGTQRWRNATGLTNFNIEVRGTIEVTDDDKDIKSISNDGYLEITKTVFGSKRSIVIESQGSGKISKAYYEGRNKMAWEPNGRSWLAEILPEIVRSTTLAAEGRVNRIYAKGGSAAVLDELSQLRGDYTTSHYAKLLLEKTIPPAELPRCITTIADLVHSDYYLSSIFQNHIEKMLSTQPAADAFFLGTKKINSDYYKSVVLKSALKKFRASTAQVKVILQSAADINSDYYLSVVLTTLLEESDVKEESLHELVAVSKNINSDYYRSQVLSSVLDRGTLSQKTVNLVVDALGDVNSDYYKTSVLNSMADHSKMDGETQLLAIKMVGSSVNSDYYASSVLKNMLQHQELTGASYNALVKVAGDLGSDSYASEVLKAASRKDLSRAQMVALLQAAQNIHSDHYLSEVLISVAPQIRTADSELKDAYRQAAKHIGSDTYYGRAVKAID